MTAWYPPAVSPGQAPAGPPPHAGSAVSMPAYRERELRQWAVGLVLAHTDLESMDSIAQMADALVLYVTRGKA